MTTTSDRHLQTAILGDVAALELFVAATPPAHAGAVVTFAGIVRNHDDGRGVLELEYAAHPTAEQILRRKVEALAARHPEVSSLRVAHRTGLLQIGDCALYAEVTAAHRAQAFAACAELVEDVKRDLPVWKRQVFTDGTEEWVNSP